MLDVIELPMRMTIGGIVGEKIMDGFPSREEALADFFEAWEPQGATELVTLDESIGRVLARDPV